MIHRAQHLLRRAPPHDTELSASGTQSFVLAAFATLVCQRNCVFLCKGTKPENSAKPTLQRHKTREFGEAEFSDCLPVSALVCVFAFDTGGLGLWGGQGFIGAKASLDPLCRFFVAQSFAFAVFATLICQRNCVFLCKGTKLQKAALFAIVCRFTAFASGNSCFISSPVQKLKNSAKQNSWTVRRFSLWNVFSFMEPAF